MPYTLTFGEIADRWKEAKRNAVKHSTFCAYALILKTHLLPIFADRSDITEEAVQQFVFDKIASGLSHKSVHDIVAVLKAITKFGAKHRFCQSSDLEILYPPNEAVRHRRTSGSCLPYAAACVSEKYVHCVGNRWIWYDG